MMKLLAALLITLALPAPAATVWRCESGGRVSYADAPCPAGRAFDATDARSAEQVAQAGQVLAADLRRAERLREERLAAQAAARAPARGPVRSVSLRPPAKKPRPPAADGTWRATAPSTRRTKD